MTEIQYKPVVFLAGGEDGVCGGRSFEARPTGRTGTEFFSITERVGGQRIDRGFAANLGEIRDNIQALVAKDEELRESIVHGLRSQGWDKVDAECEAAERLARRTAR